MSATLDDLNQMRSVREVKRLHDGELAVAVEAAPTFRDAAMQQASSRVRLPESVLQWVDERPDWNISQVAFYTQTDPAQQTGEYEGCFAVRLAPDKSKHTVTYQVPPDGSRRQLIIGLGGHQTKTGPLPRKYATKLENILDHAPGCTVESVGFWGEQGDGTTGGS